MTAFKTETGNTSIRRILAFAYGFVGLIMGGCSIFIEGIPFDFFITIVSAAFGFAGATIPDQFNTIIKK